MSGRCMAGTRTAGTSSRTAPGADHPATPHHRDTIRTWLQTDGVSVQPEPVESTASILTRASTRPVPEPGMDGRRDRRRDRHAFPPGAAHLHEHGIPVRRGGPPPQKGRGRRTAETCGPLRGPGRRGAPAPARIPERPVAGTITQRFPNPPQSPAPSSPRPAPRSAWLQSHIEQLTGQPAGHVLQLLHDHEIPVRRSGAHFPWLLRQRDTH
jgi:hypothetical protein